MQKSLQIRCILVMVKAPQRHNKSGFGWWKNDFVLFKEIPDRVMTLAAVCGDGKFRWCLIIYHHLPIIWMVFHVPTNVDLASIFVRFEKNLAPAILQLSRYRGQRDSTRIPSHFAGEIPLYPRWPTISPVKSDSLINTHVSVDETPLTKHLKSHQTTIKKP